MNRWLIRTSIAVAVVALSLTWGNVIALAAGLLIATAHVLRRGRRKSSRVAVAAVWLVAGVAAICVQPVSAEQDFLARSKMIYRLYDLNCNTPLPGYRYPRPVVWLAKGEVPYWGGWSTVLTCGR